MEEGYGGHPSWVGGAGGNARHPLAYPEPALTGIGLPALLTPFRCRQEMGVLNIASLSIFLDVLSILSISSSCFCARVVGE